MFSYAVLAAALTAVALSKCPTSGRAAQCDYICQQKLGSDKLIKCCQQAGYSGGGGCPDSRTVWCINKGDQSDCPNAVRTPQCDITCIEKRGSEAMIQCCKANGFQSGGCPNGKSVYCTRFGGK